MTVHDPIIDAQTYGADFIIEQRWEAYTPEEHAVWRTLYERQIKVLNGRAAREFYDGLAQLNLNDGGIPDLEKLNVSLQALTGWTVVCVPHLIPDDVFFEHLANRRFPAGRFIRKADQMDYIEEPSLESNSPNRLGFDLERVMKTQYRIDDFQQVYFAVDDLYDLLAATQQDFGPIYERLRAHDKTHGLTDILETDMVISRGTQAYAAPRGG